MTRSSAAFDLESSRKRVSDLGGKFPKLGEKIEALRKDLAKEYSPETVDYMLAEVLGLSVESTALDGSKIYRSSVAPHGPDETVAQMLGLPSDAASMQGKYVEEVDGDLKPDENLAKFDPTKFLPQIPASVAALKERKSFSDVADEIEKVLTKERKVRDEAVAKTGVQTPPTGMVRHLTSILGSYYANGFGVEQSKENAFGLCTESMKYFAGDVQLYFGSMAEAQGMDGDMVREQFSRAFQSFNIAATQGDERSNAALGYYYLRGDEKAGVRKNEAKAISHFSKAHLTGDSIVELITVMQGAAKTRAMLESPRSQFLGKLVTASRANLSLQDLVDIDNTLRAVTSENVKGSAYSKSSQIIGSCVEEKLASRLTELGLIANAKDIRFFNKSAGLKCDCELKLQKGVALKDYAEVLGVPVETLKENKGKISVSLSQENLIQVSTRKTAVTRVADDNISEKATMADRGVRIATMRRGSKYSASSAGSDPQAPQYSPKGGIADSSEDPTAPILGRSKKSSAKVSSTVAERPSPNPHPTFCETLKSAIQRLANFFVELVGGGKKSARVSDENAVSQNFVDRLEKQRETPAVDGDRSGRK